MQPAADVSVLRVPGGAHGSAKAKAVGKRSSCTLAHFLDRKMVKPPLFVQTIFGILGGVGPDPQNALVMRDTAKRLFGDQYHWSVLAAARFNCPSAPWPRPWGAMCASDSRTTPLHRQGQARHVQCELVAKIRRILDELSIDVAPPDEARQMLDLKGAGNVKF